MEKRHILSLTFDDGFRQSSIDLAMVSEEFGFRAGINIIPAACEPGFQPPSRFHNTPYGDWGLWRELAARGHEIMPHGWDHTDLSRLGLREAARNVEQCLESFRDNLPGFQADQAVFSLPYNASNPGIEDYLALKVRAFRVGGDGFNQWPSRWLVRLSSAGAQGDCSGGLSAAVDRLLAAERGWLIYVLHGVDGVGWNWVGADFLRRLYDRFHRTASAEVLAPAAALAKYS